MNEEKVITLNSLAKACADCHLQDVCLPIGISRKDMQRLDDIIKRKRPLPAGQALFRQGEDFRALYAIRSGSFKSVVYENNGRESINAFHFPGEILGLDSISERSCPSSAISLETSSVCELPFEELEELAQHIKGLQHQLLRIMSREIKAEDAFLRSLTHRSADQRLASFIINLAERRGNHGYSNHEFKLAMSRSDIANYLGLAVETISRLFTRFQNEGLLEIRRKKLKILKPEALMVTARTGSDSDKPDSNLAK